jgi:hypothetical protein
MWRYATEDTTTMTYPRREDDLREVEVRHIWLTPWQKLGAVIIVICALVGALAAAMQGLIAYEDLACRAGWPSFSCAQDE